MALDKFEKTILNILNELSIIRPEGISKSRLNSKIQKINFEGVLKYLYNEYFITTVEHNYSLEVISPFNDLEGDCHFKITEKGLNLRGELLRGEREESQLNFNRGLVIMTGILAFGVILNIVNNFFEVIPPPNWFIPFILNFAGLMGILIVLLVIIISERKGKD